ncbi:Na+/H+ antiporter NhaC family protein [Tomitella cavernea]|uniref:Na+/H+ antiporter NhaC family protein n=1 Tax=Tomitella cavernea TaxID=1387982 RepID=A0ABP9D070_9ACTN
MESSPGSSSPDRAPGDRGPGTLRRRALIGVSALGLAWSLAIGIAVDGPTMWGLFPIAMYAMLAFGGLSIAASTTVAVVASLLMLLPSPAVAADVAIGSLTNAVTVIGVIIVLGGALAEVLRDTGVAGQIVHTMMRLVGGRGRTSVIFGMMLSCLLLVAALGTLAGALAVAVPLLLPVAARVGLTRTATASTIFIGGCAGLALAPFAGSNVAIMTAADVGYLQYVLYGAGPLAILSIVIGMLVAPWIQRRTESGDDFYGDEIYDSDAPGGGPDNAHHPHSARAAVVFAAALAVSVVIAVLTSAGFLFPLVALPVLTVVTAVAGRLGPRRFAASVLRGGRSLIGLFALFLLLAVLFEVITLIDPFSVVLDSYGGGIGELSPFAFAVAIALIGWVGVPGATAAQVVLLDQFFGSIGAAIGVGTGTWVIVLLFASKADTYGPFPNPNMMSAMGLARSLNLKYMLLTGWLLLVPSACMYLLIMFLESR